MGTLIGFETGILDWFRPALKLHGVSETDEEILATFAAVEEKYQRETPEKPFTGMLPLIYRDVAFSWGIGFRDEDAKSLRDSIRSWPPFPDTVGALNELGTRYRLAAVTNADAWALEHMGANLGDPFQEKVTCDEVGTNKPNPRVSEYVLEKLAPRGVEKKDVLHTAQSQYHDIAPATKMGFVTMWIERRHGKNGLGATPRPGRVVAPTFHATGVADPARRVREEQ